MQQYNNYTGAQLGEGWMHVQMTKDQDAATWQPADPFASCMHTYRLKLDSSHYLPGNVTGNGPGDWKPDTDSEIAWLGVLAEGQVSSVHAAQTLL
jgi:hypothetical protein